MTIRDISFCVFMAQLFLQLSLKNGWFSLKYTTTTPMHEDLITTLLFCTFLIVSSIQTSPRD